MQEDAAARVRVWREDCAPTGLLQYKVGHAQYTIGKGPIRSASP